MLNGIVRYFSRWMAGKEAQSQPLLVEMLLFTARWQPKA